MILDPTRTSFFSNPLSTKDISNFQINTDVLKPVYETVCKVRKELDNNKTLIGFCGGPWTVATYMLEGKGTPNKELAKKFAYENEEATNDLLDYLVAVSAEYLIKQAEAGVDVLQIFESWASDLSPYLFNKLVIVPTKKIIKRIRDAGVNIPIIGFPKNCGLSINEYVKNSGITAIAVSTETPLDLVLVIQALVVLFIAAPALVKALFRLKNVETGEAVASKGWNG